MAKKHKPVSGSRGFWPKKRAKRIYPRFNRVSGPAKALGFAAYKAGMTQVSLRDMKKGSVTEGEEIARPVTILDCPPLVICGIKAYKSSTYGLRSSVVVWAEKTEKDLKRKTFVPKKPKAKAEDIDKMLDSLADIRLLAHPKTRESGVGKKTPELVEIPIGGEVKEKWAYARDRLGKELKITDVFAEGEYVDASAVSKGKGYQGPVKRFGVKIRSRKNEKKRRHVGTLGAWTPARVLPGKIAMPGQLGFQTRTEFNKKIVKLGTGGIESKGGLLNYGKVPGDFMLLEGSVPGPKKRFVLLRPGLRAPQQETVELVEVYLDSQQGV